MSRFTRLLFPPKCAACKELLDWYDSDGATALCPSCAKQWAAKKQETCGICGKRVTACDCVTEEMRKAKCASFRKLIYYHGGTREPVQNRLIYHVKESRSASAHTFLANELIASVREILESVADRQSVVLTFVPRGRSAKLQYGTDQAEELAQALSRGTGLPCHRLITRADQGTRAQKALSASARLHNAKDSFVLSRRAEVSGKTILLVDDIVTTGSSMAVCARLLRRAGAKAVYCLAIASDDVNRERT